MMDYRGAATGACKSPESPPQNAERFRLEIVPGVGLLLLFGAVEGCTGHYTST